MKNNPASQASCFGRRVLHKLNDVSRRLKPAQFILVPAILFIAASQPLRMQAQVHSTRTLTGHVPNGAKSLPAIGKLSDTNRLHLAIGLPLRNQTALNNFLQELYDPNSPNFRHYLTTEEFTERFGPTEQDYQAVADFAKARGFLITGTHPNRLVLDVSAAVSDIEKAFGVTMRTYQHPTEARTFYAPDVEPSVDVTVPILEISGLDNYSLPRPNSHVRPLSIGDNAVANTGSGPGRSYLGRDFRTAYAPGVSLTGTGQTIGLLEFDGYYASDITSYETTARLPSVPLTIVAVDGGTAPGPANDEVCLDIEMAISMAPGLSGIYVYEAPNPSPWVDLLSRMANDNPVSGKAKQLSCSWTGGGPSATAEQIFQQMAAQGQTFFTAAGDHDAYTGSIPFPADSPNVVVVGGTSLSTGAGGAWSSESVWNDGYLSTNPPAYWGGSGGISTYYSIPAWQQGVSMTSNLGSTTRRNIPDVALTATNVYVTYNNGASRTSGGTSAATPLWAGFTALVNQQAASKGLSPVGYLNPLLYAIGKSANYTADFHDIKTGNNFNGASPTKFPAVTGYDLCTGWGTPNGANLINDLVTAAGNKPNLLPYQPSGWSDKLVISRTTGTHTDSSPLYQTDTLYVDFGILNNGPAATSSQFYSDVYVDGVRWRSLTNNTSINSGAFVTFEDISLGSLTPGNHTIQVRIDAGNAIAELNEADNNYTKNISIGTAFSIAVSTPYSTEGSVSGGGSYPSGTTVTLTATPNPGYEFVNWTVGTSVVSTSLTYTFVATGNLVLTANFRSTAPMPAGLYVANDGDNTIVRIDSGGNSTVFANSGLNAPSSLAFASNGDLYVSNSGDNTIAKFDSAGNGTLVIAASAGLSNPNGIAFDTAGNLYVADTAHNAIVKFDPAGNKTVFAQDYAQLLGYPRYLAFDSSGNLYASNTNGPASITKFDSAGNPSAFAVWNDGSGVNAPFGLAFDSHGNLYVVNHGYAPETIIKFDPSGHPVTFASAGLSAPWGLGFDHNDNAYVVDPSNNTIERVDPAGNVGTFSNASLNEPLAIAIREPFTPASYSITVTSSPVSGGTTTGGGTYVRGANVTVTAVANGGYVFNNWTENGTIVSTTASYTFGATSNRSLVANFGPPDLTAVYVTSNSTNTVVRFDTSGNGTVYTNQGLSSPYGIAFDNTGRVYTSNFNNTIVRYDPATGSAQVFANATTGLSFPWGLAFDSSGNLFVANRNASNILKFDSAGHPTVFASAGLLYFPQGLAFDSSGNLFVSNYNNTIVKFDPSGNGTLFPTSNLIDPVGLAFDKNGNLFVANSSGYKGFHTWGHSILKIDPSGTVSEFIDSNSNLYNPLGIAFDDAGNLFVVSEGTSTIYKFDSLGNQIGAFSSLLSQPMFLAVRPGGFLNPPPPNYTISLSSSPVGGGSFVGGGLHPAGSSVTITATPNTGYTFANWAEQGVVVSTTANYTFVANSNRNLVANFDPINPITISAGVSPDGSGTVAGAGIYPTGLNVVLIASANSGYTFTSWLENGAVVSTSVSYSFTAASNRTLVARFSAINPVTISVSASPGNGGAVTGGDIYASGSSVTVTATPKVGYGFANWTESGAVVSTSASYTFTANSVRTLVANFRLLRDFYVSSFNGQTVQRFGPDGTNLGTLATTSTGLSGPQGLAFDASGRLYVANRYTNRIERYNSAGVHDQTPFITGLGGPTAIVFDANGNLYVANLDTNDVRKFNSAGQLLATIGIFQPLALAVDSGGNVYASSYRDNNVRKFGSNLNNLGIFASGFSYPGGLAFDAVGNLYVTNYNTAQIHKIAPNGTRLAIFSSPGFTLPHGIVFDSFGSFYVVSEDNTVHKFASDGTHLTAFGGGLNEPEFIVLGPPPITISLSASPTAGGIVSGDGGYPSGSSVTVAASPNTGYAFTNWTENGNVVNTSSNYTFTAAANRALIANFVQITYTISASALPSAGGTVNGSGAFAPGANVTLLATANPGYDFVNWTDNGSIVSTSSSYVFTATANRSLVANFSAHSYQISVTASPAAGGVVNLNNSGTTGFYTYGFPVIAAATANPNYTFSSWTENGNVVSTSATYSFAAAADRNLVANFTANYTIATNSSPTNGGTTSGGGTFAANTSQTVTATANSGYSFSSWTENGSFISSSSSYTFTLTGNRNLVANFSANAVNYTITTSSSPANGGTTSGGGTFAANTSQTVAATANNGYTFSNWTENGSIISSSRSYTFTLTGNRNLVATFTPINSGPTDLLAPNGGFENGLTGWTLTGNGGISTGSYPHSGTHYAYLDNANNATGTLTSIAVTIPSNVTTATLSFWLNVGSQEITVGPYDILKVNLIDGSHTAHLLAQYSEADKGANGAYVQHSFDVSAYKGQQVQVQFIGTTNSTLPTFFRIDDVSLLVSGTTGTTYTISTSSSPSSGGTTSGAGTFSANSSQTVTATANSGYTFSNWTENGGVVSTSTSYTFTLTSNRNLVANFTANTANYTITTSSSPTNGGTTSGGGTFAANTSQTVIATANSGYTFSNWTENGGVVSSSSSYTFSLTGNRNLVANFTQNQINYTITTSSSPTNGGTTSGGGTFAANTTQTVTATANSGYTFSNWTENGSIISSSSSYTFTLTANRNLVANFTTNSGPTDLLAPNGGFENGLIGWTLTGNGGISTGSYPHSGTHYAYLGNTNNAYGTLTSNAVTIPSNVTSATLSFWLNVGSQETTVGPYDILKVNLVDSSNLAHLMAQYSEADKGANGAYVQHSFDVSAYKGQQVRVQFVCTTDSTLSTFFRVDDVSLVVSSTTTASFAAPLSISPNPPAW